MIELKQIFVDKNGDRILENINLTINRGDKILIQGESGSGKSTLIKTILFYTQFVGEIFYRDKQVNQSTISVLRQEVGYIGQVLPHINTEVTDFLQLPYQFQANGSIHPNPTKQKEQLARLGLPETILQKNFSQLSGGEKQRLMTLQILALQRPIYFFDEITSALDKTNIKKIITLITADPQRTIVSISHNPEWLPFCNRFVSLDRGRILEEN